ncbi:MAG TPA: alpha-L-fucosidase [Ignavibacteria bacterium]
MNKKILIFIILSLNILLAQQKEKIQNEDRLQWFKDAKFGIFIHYGIYAVNGIDESWSFYHNKISYEDYMKQLEGFTAKNYDPNKWANFFKEVGAKYAVMTSKHHDGVALWDTKLSDLSVVKKSPAKRDLLKPYADALRKVGLKVGVYFSHLDWSHPDYATVYNGNDTLPKNPNYYDVPMPGKQSKERWENFIKFRNGQLEEVFKLVNPDLWWFDGDWTRTKEQWKMKELRDLLLSWNPNVILNSRMQGYGDYATPEQGIPIYGPNGPWELCLTINNSWGYQHKDTNHKSVSYLIRIFADCISLGGNLLLDIGPMEDGSISPEQTERLKGLGRWINKHAEAIYGTERGIPFEYFLGPTTLSKDKKTLYCFVINQPKHEIIVKGIKNKIKNIRLIGTNENLNYKIVGKLYWSEVPGVLQVFIPQEKADENITVFAIDLDSPLELYSDKK